MMTIKPRNTPWSLVATVLFSTCVCGAESPNDAHTFTAQIDLRLVHSTALNSFVYDTPGQTRFDREHDGLQLGRAFVEYKGRLLDTLDAHLTLDAYGDADKNPLDLTEAYLEWRPYPTKGWRWRAQVGAFHPPVSLENRRPGWQSMYSLSPSAINTWIGEEIRTLGAEATATWLGTRNGAPFDLSFIGGVYGWNDPAGVLIFQRGWGIHDRQTALFGGVPRLFPRGTTRKQLELFHEIDNKPGFYAGMQLTHPAGITFSVLRYDNHGDPAATNGYEPAWLTRFDSAGLRLQTASDWTFIAQWMAGDTAVGRSADGRGLMILDYDAWFALLSRDFGKHRLTVRSEEFYTEMARGAQFFDGYQDGTAQLLAYTYTHDKHWQVVGEASRIDSKLEQRTFLGFPERAVEETLQLAVRYTY